LTVGQACDAYMERYAIPRKRSHAEDADRIKRHIKPAIGFLLYESLTPTDVQKFFDGIKKPIEANRTLTLLSTVYNVVNRFGLSQAPNPCRAVQRHKEWSRDRYLPKDKVTDLLSALSHCEPVQAAAIKLLLLTGCRKMEVLSLAWDNVDLEARTIRLSMTKNGKPRNVPLTDNAVDLFSSIPKTSKFVFPSPRDPSKHMRAVRRTWERACKLANIEDAHLHDLRRTVGSLLVQSGVTLPVIAATLGHSNTYVTHVYARISNEIERSALSRFSELIHG